jgi:uncharacterized protein YkwD
MSGTTSQTHRRRGGIRRKRLFVAGLGLIATLVLGIAVNPTSAVTVEQVEADVVALTNRHRAEVGCKPLTVNPKLESIAAAHSDDMAGRDYFAHTNLGGQDPFDRIAAAGYLWRTAGENLAAGRWRPGEVLEQWLTSKGHRENIENCAFTEIGVALAVNSRSTYRYYWTQVLAAPKSK